jgi:hypothetical protein
MGTEVKTEYSWAVSLSYIAEISATGNRRDVQNTPSIPEGSAMPAQSHVALSADGVPIHYHIQGNGATALVFVHGWCCHRRFWDRQVAHFAAHYTTASIDVGGHGTSGRDRT